MQHRIAAGANERCDLNTQEEALRVTSQSPQSAHAHDVLLITLPSVALIFLRYNRGRSITVEKDWITAAPLSQSRDSTVLFLFGLSCERKKKKPSENLCSEFSRKKCFIKRLMFIDFSFMSVLLFCLCSGKRSLCIIICERSEMSEVSF